MDRDALFRRRVVDLLTPWVSCRSTASPREALALACEQPGLVAAIVDLVVDPSPGDAQRAICDLQGKRRSLLLQAVAGDRRVRDRDAVEVSGARIVWDPEPDTMRGEFDRNRRATVRVSDLLGTSSAVLDIESRELLEMATSKRCGQSVAGWWTRTSMH